MNCALTVRCAPTELFAGYPVVEVSADYLGYSVDGKFLVGEGNVQMQMHDLIFKANKISIDADEWILDLIGDILILHDGLEIEAFEYKCHFLKKCATIYPDRYQSTGNHLDFLTLEENQDDCAPALNTLRMASEVRKSIVYIESKKVFLHPYRRVKFEKADVYVNNEKMFFLPEMQLSIDDDEILSGFFLKSIELSDMPGISFEQRYFVSRAFNGQIFGYSGINNSELAGIPHYFYELSLSGDLFSKDFHLIQYQADIRANRTLSDSIYYCYNHPSHQLKAKILWERDSFKKEYSNLFITDKFLLLKKLYLKWDFNIRSTDDQDMMIESELRPNPSWKTSVFSHHTFNSWSSEEWNRGFRLHYSPLGFDANAVTSWQENGEKDSTQFHPNFIINKFPMKIGQTDLNYSLISLFDYLDRASMNTGEIYQGSTRISIHSPIFQLFEGLDFSYVTSLGWKFHSSENDVMQTGLYFTLEKAVKDLYLARAAYRFESDKDISSDNWIEGMSNQTFEITIHRLNRADSDFIINIHLDPRLWEMEEIKLRQNWVISEFQVASDVFYDARERKLSSFGILFSYNFKIGKIQMEYKYPEQTFVFQIVR